jgi:hypothetical protein
MLLNGKLVLLASSIFAILILAGSIVFLYPSVGYRVYYNCDISEISPDYPMEVKEKCRQLRLHKHLL